MYIIKWKQKNITKFEICFRTKYIAKKNQKNNIQTNSEYPSSKSYSGTKNMENPDSTSRVSYHHLIERTPSVEYNKVLVITVYNVIQNKTSNTILIITTLYLRFIYIFGLLTLSVYIVRQIHEVCQVEILFNKILCNLFNWNYIPFTYALILIRN